MAEIIFQSSVPSKHKISITPKEFEAGQSNDKEFKVLLEKTKDLALQFCPNPTAILEFGAGTGLFSEVYVPRYSNSIIVISEPDKNLLEVIPPKFSKTANIVYVQSVAEEFSWKEKFDLIIGTEAYHHVPDNKKTRLFLNFHNLLKNDGYLVVGDNFLPDYNINDPNDRIRALHKFWDPYIEEKRKMGDVGGVHSFTYALGQAEAGVMEYKTSLSIFENYTKEAGFKITKKEQLSKNISDLGGYCIYVLKKL